MSGHYCARITKDAHGQLRCAECGRLMRRDEQGWIVPVSAEQNETPGHR